MNSKIPFVLTALCASVGMAQAQSVEVFGVLDVAYLSTSAGRRTGSRPAGWHHPGGDIDQRVHLELHS